MKEEILKLGKHTLIYGVGMLISKAASFVMLPIYTNYLTPNDYGIIELLTMTLDIIAMIAGIGLADTIFKYYSEYQYVEDKKEVIGTAALVMITVSLITTILGIIFSDKLSSIVFGQSGNHFYFQLFFLIYFLQEGIIVIPAIFIRAMQNSKLFVLICLIKLAMQLCFNIYFLVVLNMGISGVLYSTLLADFIIGLYLSLYTFRKVGFRFSVTKSKILIKFGYPFIFASLSSFILTFSDRYFLNAFTNLETVGIYALAYKFGFILAYLVIVPFAQIWEPHRFEIAKQDNAAILFKRVFLYFNIVLFTCSLFISLFVKDVLTIMSAPAFLEAYKIVPIIIIAYVFYAWTFYCNFGIYLKGRSTHMAIAYILSAIGVTALNLILIPKYGAYGAASAAVGAFSLRFILVYFFSQKNYFIDYGWGKQLQIFVLSILCYLTGSIVETPQIMTSLGKNLLLMFLFGFIIYRFFLNEYEKRFIKRLLTNPISVAKRVQRVSS